MPKNDFEGETVMIAKGVHRGSLRDQKSRLTTRIPSKTARMAKNLPAV
jgi:hypothetical protein